MEVAFEIVETGVESGEAGAGSRRHGEVVRQVTDAPETQAVALVVTHHHLYGILHSAKVRQRWSGAVIHRGLELLDVGEEYILLSLHMRDQALDQISENLAE